MQDIATSMTTSEEIRHINMFGEIVITSNHGGDVEVLDKHNLTTKTTINTNENTVQCSLMISGYLYLGCYDNKQLLKVDMKTS